MDPNARLKAMEEESPGGEGRGTQATPDPAGTKDPAPGDTPLPGSWQARTQVVSIAVPLGWKRVVEAGAVVYYRYHRLRLVLTVAQLFIKRCAM